MSIVTARVNQFSLNPGITLTTPDAGTSPAVDLQILNSHVDMRESSPGSGIRGPVGIDVAVTTGSTCANVLTNISHLYPTNITPQGGGIRLEQGGSGVFTLERGAATLGTAADVVLGTNNPAPTGTDMVTAVAGALTVVENGTCLLPSAP
ncbi:MAG: hypothetical protein R2712_22635 [Vicinamibacterales bacterium]